MESETNSTMDETNSTEITEEMSSDLMSSTMNNEVSSTEMSLNLMDQSEFLQLSNLSNECGWTVINNSAELNCVINNITSFNKNNYIHNANANAVSLGRLNDSLNICLDERNYLILLIFCGSFFTFILGYFTKKCCGNRKSRKKVSF